MNKTIEKPIIIRISVLILLSMTDYVLTVYAISSGIGSEANPVLSWLTLEGIGLAKTLGILVLIYRYWDRPNVTWLVAGILAVVVIWNMGVICG